MTAVLIISPEPWSAQAVSKHHYARVLADSGRDVLFVDPPASVGGISVTRLEGQGNVWLVRGPRVAPGLRMLPGWIRRWLESRWLSQVERLSGLKVSTVWSFENSRFYDLGFAGRRLKIYHQVDLNQNFHPMIAARTADVCLCSTDAICSRLKAVRSDVHKIHHGAAVPGCIELGPDEAGAFAGGGIHAAYVGNLNIPYLDTGALSRIIKSHSDVMFHLVGTYDARTPLLLACQGQENVKWWGRRSYEEIPAILNAVDVLLVAYDAAQFRDQLASPHKLMEYLLSGKTVVASYTDEYKDKRQLIEMADLGDEIDPIFRRVISHLGEYNSPTRMEMRRAFATENSYQRHLDRISSIVFSANGKEI